MSNSAIESKRVKKFRLSLINEIPRSPNDKTTLTLLEKKDLTELLVIDLSWRLRFVRQGKRTVDIKPSASTDPRWKSLSTDIIAFLQKVKDGDDLTPYLSDKVQKRGFTMAASTPGKDSWADKDFLLNVMGFHHFHLKPMPSRTNDVIFASVSREVFNVIGIFNHDVFENDDPQAMPAERVRLWNIYDDIIDRGAPPGAFFIGGIGGLGVTTSGHPMDITMTALSYRRIIDEIDPQLDDFSYLQKIFAPDQVPRKQKFSWEFNFLDLGVHEMNTGNFFLFKEGPN